jgi:hypothetical protein
LGALRVRSVIPSIIVLIYRNTIASVLEPE